MVRIAPLGGAEPQGSWALHCHFYFTDVRILRLLPDDSHILLNRGADILESLILGLALRPATREPGHSYQIWYRATVGRSNTAALPGFVSSTHRWSDETRERTSSPLLVRPSGLWSSSAAWPCADMVDASSDAGCSRDQKQP